MPSSICLAGLCVSLETALNHYWNKVGRKIIIYNYTWGADHMILLIAFPAIFIFGILRLIKGLGPDWWRWQVCLAWDAVRATPGLCSCTLVCEYLLSLKRNSGSGWKRNPRARKKVRRHSPSRQTESRGQWLRKTEPKLPSRLISPLPSLCQQAGQKGPGTATGIKPRTVVSTNLPSVLR
jgi:hypothetical protein